MVANMDRRDFLKTGSIATVGTYFAGSVKTHLMAAPEAEPAKPIAANDNIQIALIGAGGQGQGDTKQAALVPGVKVVAAADCYNGCLDHAKELWGNDILATRDYNEILARKDIDAVIIGTPDHWHMQASVDALNAGKDVYCEKPMIHVYSDGPKIIDTWRKSGRIMQIGSQRVSSIIYHKAKELLAAGAIGTLNMVTVWYDRNSAQGRVGIHGSLRCLTRNLRLAALARHGAADSLQRRTLLPVAQVEGLRKRRGGRFVRPLVQRRAPDHQYARPHARPLDGRVALLERRPGCARRDDVAL